MDSSTVANTEAAERYLDLMKQCLTRSLFLDEEVRDLQVRDWRKVVFDPALKVLARRGMRVVRTGGDAERRANGRGCPPSAETMVGLKRLDNVQHCVVDVIKRDVPGDLIETGVWRGGTTIFMRAVLAAMGDKTRRVWVADSFAGLPRPDLGQYPSDTEFSQECPALAVSESEVKANFSKYGLLDSQVQFLKGWFKDTLPSAPVSNLAVMRLDGDLYESTMDALEALYPRLSDGGYVIIDDYGAWKPCRQAVDDYRASNDIREPIEEVDWTAVFWKKAG